MTDPSPHDSAAQDSDRLEALARLEEWIETPMQVLGFVWLGLLVIELTQGLNPLLGILSGAIWILFIADFLLRLALAPDKRKYFGRNWLVAISLVVPAFRILRLARAFRALRVVKAARGARLISIVGSLNRGMRALRSALAKRGFIYVVILTVLVILVGAAGMQAFERELPGGGALDSYAEAIWWTAMIMTTLGSDYWPQSPEGRVLCLLLATYSFAVWGYITASLASFFIDREAAGSRSSLARDAGFELLCAEIATLRAEVARMRSSLPPPPTRPEISD